MNFTTDFVIEPTPKQFGSESALGLMAAAFTVGPAIFLGFHVVESFIWACATEPCFFTDSSPQARSRIGSAILLLIVLIVPLVLQFVFILVIRPFTSRPLVEGTFLRYSMKFLRWHDDLLRQWIGWLWRS